MVGVHFLARQDFDERVKRKSLGELSVSEIDQLKCSRLFRLTASIQCNHLCALTMLLLVSGHCYKAASVQLTVHVPVSEHSQLLSDHERRVSNSLAVRPDDLTKVLLISIRAESVWLLTFLHVHLAEVLVEVAESGTVEQLVVAELRNHHRLLHRFERLLAPVEEERSRPVLVVLVVFWRERWAESVGHCVVLVVLRGGLEHGSDGVQVGADHRRADHGARRRQLLVGNQLRRLLTHLVVLHHLLLLLAALWLEVVLHQVELVIVGKRRNVLLLVLPLPEAVGGTGAGVTVIGELASG